MINAFVTLRFNIPSFIATLGTMLFWRGFTLFVHGASSQRFNPSQAFTNLMAGNIDVIEAAFIWYVALSLVFWVLLHHHKVGNHFFAVGGNKQAATAIGINPTRVKMIAFAITGFCAAFGGILATARVGSVLPGQGSGLELQAIAACVIGGVALTGGRGTILGIFLGAVLMYTIQDILLLVRAPGFYLDIFVGLLIVGAADFQRDGPAAEEVRQPMDNNLAGQPDGSARRSSRCARSASAMARSRRCATWTFRSISARWSGYWATTAQESQRSSR